MSLKASPLRFSTISFLALIVSILTSSPAVAQPLVPIYDIQGAGHISPFVGQTVTTIGVVTAVAFDGYYVQDPVGDGDETTSDGMFVFKTSSKPKVGDRVQLTDTIVEFIPGGAATGNLSTTEMTFPLTTVLSAGNPLPPPVIIGSGGRIPPNEDVISEDELPVNLQTSAGTFNPEDDGIDFYESLEGMLVTLEDSVAVSATRRFSAFSSELFVLPNNGAHIDPDEARTARGGINLQPHPDNLGDQNPERVQIQFDGTLFPFPVPAITVGDRLGNVTGVVGYSFGNFEVNALAPFSVTPSGLGLETTPLVTPDADADIGVTVASYNVLNLSAVSADNAQRATLASHFVNNLATPDVIALQEIQDNNAEINDGTTDATQTLQKLVDAVVTAGGPAYSFFDVAPANNTSGGVPGGNIRNAFLYNPARVDLVSFVSLTPSVLSAAGVGNPNAFSESRNPLSATFEFNGVEFTVINNHLTSRTGSTPIFGGPQPFVQAGEAEREGQMQALNEYVDFLLSAAGDEEGEHTAIVVLGDLNTFEFTNDLTEILPGAEELLTDLIDSLTDDNVYTFIFDGNSQMLDHLLVTKALQETQLDIVHVNVDFPRISTAVGSDHEPLVALLDFGELLD